MHRLALLVLLTSVAAPGAMEAEVAAGLDRGIGFLEARVKSDPLDFAASNQLVARLLRRYRWAGRLEDLRRADEVSQLSIAAAPPDLNPAGVAERAAVLYALHRFGESAELARQLEAFTPGKSVAQQLLGNSLLESGEVGAAEQAFAEAKRRGEPDRVSEYAAARLALQRGSLDAVSQHLDRVVASASTESTDVKVWALVQRGEHAFRRGQHEAAEKDYRAADALAPNQWSVQTHLAELAGAQGRYEEAAKLFEAAATATDRPELWQALGDLHLFYQKPESAVRPFEQARRGYEASLERGELIYVHHLAGFFCDSQPDPARALELARQDLATRKTAASWDGLAWALYRSGDFAGACVASEKAIGGGIRDSHILYHAGMIHLSAGRIAEGQRLLKQAAEVNPHFAGFHMHH